MHADTLLDTVLNVPLLLPHAVGAVDPSGQNASSTQSAIVEAFTQTRPAGHGC
jgi:hypothetical protein